MGRSILPYSYFRYSIINEQGPDGSWHQKMSGFDGSYFIIRVDVSDLIEGAPEGSYLHVKQEGNKAMMPLLEYKKYDAAAGKGSFSDALGNMSVSYAIDNGAISMKDKEGNDTNTPYVDVIVYSSGTLVAGADTGSTGPTVANADFTLKFYIDQTADYDPSLDYNPNDQSTGTPTHAEKVMAKFYDESKASGAQITSYKIKGNDLEIEIMNDASSPRHFWSLRKAMSWYNNSPIKMICEVPVLEGLLIDGGRNVIFDVNSFDIQIANHQATDAAALTVRNGTLKVMDSFNTTGAELAVGNNARMSIEAGGTLIIDETCQVEVEYDAASVAPGEGATPVTYDFGVISIANGGHIINNGVISIEGTEGKPIDPANPAMRDMKAAELHIKAGGKLTNNGCLVAYGGLYNLGTLENNGHYNETITSNDPDKGKFTYHKGIQVAWKDDVTQDGVRMGYFSNGEAENQSATFINNGDPTMPNADFLGWFNMGKEYEFNSVVDHSTTLTAGWAPKSIDFKLPAGTTTIGQAAFEGASMKSVEIPASCERVQAGAFKNCDSLTQVRILSSYTTFDETAFSDCQNVVYIFAPFNSPVQSLCTEDSGLVFVEDVIW